MNKLAVLAIVAGAFMTGQAGAASDPCDVAAYNYAEKKQKEDYPGKKLEREQVTEPEVTFDQKMKNGFESWFIEYNVQEECREGYSLLLRRSNDGKSCAVIKEISDTSRDCG